MSLVQDSLGGKDNLSTTTKKVLTKLGVGSIKIRESVPAKGSLLIISNHPGVFDSIALLSTTSREDLYFMALYTYSIFGSKISKQLLPIYRKRKLNHFLYEYPLSLQLNVPFFRSLPKDEMYQRNRETITYAAKLVNENHAVSIFPTGSAGKKLKDSTWKPGVGFLVKQINNPNTKVVFSSIKGTKQTDIFAYMRPFIKKLFFKPQPITITFSKPTKLVDIVGSNNDPKQITRILENKYQQWSNNL